MGKVSDLIGSEKADETIFYKLLEISNYFRLFHLDVESNSRCNTRCFHWFLPCGKRCLHGPGLVELV